MVGHSRGRRGPAKPGAVDVGAEQVGAEKMGAEKVGAEKVASAAGTKSSSSSAGSVHQGDQVLTQPATGDRAVDTSPADRAGSPAAHHLRRLLTAPATRLAFLVLAVTLGAFAVASQWSEVRTGFAKLGPPALLAALALALATCAATFAVWRGLLAAFGSPLPRRDAARVFFVGQLGKYVPGSVWSVVAQMELGKAHAVPRSRSALVAAVTMLVSLSSALLVAAGTLPWASDAATDGYLWAFAAVPVLLVALHPRIANPGLRALFRRLRRPPMERPLSGRDLFQATTRSLLAWLLAGTHVWLLAVQLGAPIGQTFLLATGGFAFAWAVGFLIVFAPAGAGVRELILIAALSPVLDPGKATAVALASRLVTILADLLAAGAAAGWAAGPRLRDRLARPARDSDPDRGPDAEPAAIRQQP
jgi:glycosyltransferase 2 family protein